MVSQLFDLSKDQLAIIADGTYLYCQKSSNNRIQRITYSSQKKRHLVKPFVITTTNGRILDIYGPFAANVNDASILEYLLENEIDLIELLNDNDLFILDRGFRNNVKMLKEKKLNVKLPTCNFNSKKYFYFNFLLYNENSKVLQLTKNS